MSKVFLTGGSGRLGKYVIEALRENGYDILALSRKGELQGCSTIKGDLFNFDYTKLVGCEWAVHVAGSADMSLSYPSLYNINVEGTKSVVERCELAGIKKFLYVSSISVYGKKDNPHITESTTLNPDTPYAKSKFEGELVTKNFVGQVCIIRPSIIYGEGFDAGFRMAYEMIKCGRMVIFGNGSNRVPLVYAGDVAQAIVNVIERDASGIYNINNDDEMTQRELVDYVSRIIGVQERYVRIPRIISKPVLGMYNAFLSVKGKKPIPYEFIDMLATDRVVIAKKAKDELGFKNIDLKVGLKEFVEYLSKSGPARN